MARHEHLYPFCLPQDSKFHQGGKKNDESKEENTAPHISSQAEMLLQRKGSVQEPSLSDLGQYSCDGACKSSNHC